jgi:DNA invertase Pin-like site-specific DNA recombinase
MFIRAYLRASTLEQDALRAKDTLKEFAAKHGHRIASYYIENKSGNSLNRPELSRLLAESEKGDILLVESIDRLTRLNGDNWKTLVTAINEKGVLIVSLDLPTSHLTFNTFPSDEFMNSILSAINNMLLEILAAGAYKEFTERERKQKEGIARAKEKGLYKGRKANQDKHEQVKTFILSGKFSNTEIAEATKVSKSTVIRIKKTLNLDE